MIRYQYENSEKAGDIEMIKQSICKNCGSHKFEVRTYTLTIIPYEKYTGEITKELFQEEGVVVGEEPRIRTELMCAECGEVIEQIIDIDELNTRELCTELQKRVEDLEQFREETNMKAFEESIINR